MMDFSVEGVQLGPNPAYSGESFIISITISGTVLKWDDIKNRTWNEVSNKGWD